MSGVVMAATADLPAKNTVVLMETSMGNVKIQLDPQKAPISVKNFLDYVKSGFYDGTVFHRVIPGFMIQGGDPLGVGAGSPGYTFEDEFQSGRKFDKVGLLAMANRGPETNGSQFFITVSTPEYLNGRHTIFGEVVKGYDVVERISLVPRGGRDKPQQDVVLKKVVLSDEQPK
ncbi:MAG: peptidylprolyl isomerase [Archangium sp.]